MAPDRFRVTGDHLAEVGGVWAVSARPAAGAIGLATGKRPAEGGVELRPTGVERIRGGEIRLQGKGEEQSHVVQFHGSLPSTFIPAPRRRCNKIAVIPSANEGPVP